MKTFFSLLQIIPIFVLIGCGGNSTNYQPFPLSNIQTDFPECDSLTFKDFNTYNLFNIGYIEIRDSLLWAFNVGSKDHIGYCYNLYTKEKYSSIAAIGRAANELDQHYKHSLIANDSVYFFYSFSNTIKSIAQKDIINNVPMGERAFVITKLPDSLYLNKIFKLPNGSMLAIHSFNLRQKYPTTNDDVNSPFISIIDNNIKTYPVIDYNSYHFKMHDEQQLSRIDFIRHSYASGCISCKNNSTVVLSVNDQGILYTLDLTNGKIIHEKRYSEMKCGKGSFSSSNEMDLGISSIASNDRYIFCIIEGYMNEIDKKEKRRKQAILVFDWSLNPIKRFSLSSDSSYFFSKTNPLIIYKKKTSDTGLTLFKAFLKL